jgi:membrane associated rhomboid family serine protease
MYYRVRRDDNLVPMWVIMGINLLVFIFALFNKNNAVALLGFQPATILNEPWTIITSIFTHVSFWHIFANMLTLYFFGRFMVGLVGNKYMLIIYFIAGIVGNLFFFLFGLIVPGAMYTIVIGASGAIFGLGGALAVLRPTLRVVTFPIPIPMPLWVAILVGFVILSIVPGIAWQAHLGGLICGLIAGLFLRKRASGIIY